MATIYHYDDIHHSIHKTLGKSKIIIQTYNVMFEAESEFQALLSTHRIIHLIGAF